MWSHKLLGPVLGSCRGAPLAAQHPMGLRTAMPTALCTATNLKTLTQNPPFVAQSHLCSKPAGVGHVSSPGSDFQVPRCEGIPVLGLGMALSSPCHRPLVGKDRTKPCLPPWCRAGRAQLPSPGRCWEGGKKRRESPEECAGLSIPPGWRQNICHSPASPAPERVPGQTDTPILPSVSPR